MGDINFELKILDEDYRNIGFWKFRKNQLVKFMRIINNKHNLGITIKEKKNDDRDIDWAKN